MKIGDLVTMRWLPGSDPGRKPTPGIILAFHLQEKWAQVLWSDHGMALEKIRDLEVINEDW